MSEKAQTKKAPIVEVFTDEQYDKAKQAGANVIDRRMDSPAELKGESEAVVINGLDRDEDDEIY